jgi:hypothetical protein
VQTAYVVKDITAAMNWWIRDGKVGPWFLLDSFTGSDQRYRGEATTADVKIAMAFAGHMMIELVQPKDRQPSVYKEVIDQRGYGFHHIGIAVSDVEVERAAYAKRGATPGMDEMFTRYWRASVDWKGEDPIRPFG